VEHPEKCLPKEQITKFQRPRPVRVPEERVHPVRLCTAEHISVLLLGRSKKIACSESAGCPYTQLRPVCNDHRSIATVPYPRDRN